jgi:hypothetical protein
MTAFVVSDRRTTTFNLAALDSLHLTSTGLITATSANAIFGTGPNTLIVDGDVIQGGAFGDAIRLDTGGNNVTVNASSVVSGLRGISSGDGFNAFSNSGQIIGTSGAGVAFFGSEAIRSSTAV